MSFGQLTVRAKLALTFGMMAALVVLVSVIALSALGDANDSFASYVDGARARAALTEKIRAAVLQRAVAVRNLVLHKEECSRMVRAIVLGVNEHCATSKQFSMPFKGITRNWKSEGSGRSSV